MRRTLTTTAGAAASAALGLGLLAGPASAQPQQEGLVNVNVSDVTVQVPVGIAANVCDLTVAALAEVIDEAGACSAVATADAENRNRPGGSPQQDGLVNVNISDVVVQIPVGVAANVCDTTVAALAQLQDDARECEAVSTVDAEA